jgi:carboxypeptidase family protein
LTERYRKSWLGILAFFFISGCGSDPTPRGTPLVAPTRAFNPATASSIAGKVTLEGKPLALKPIDMGAEAYCEKLNVAPVFPQQVVAGPSGSLANVVVYIKDFPADYIVDPPVAAPTLSQRGCMYDPHIVALRTGQVLEIKNEDQATHNVLAMPEQNPKWNRSEAPGAPPIEETFATPELAIPVRCNVHPWMKSYVFVFGHPYYSVTGNDGRFELKNIPPGTYTIEAWQEKYGKQDATITVGPKESKSIDFTFGAASGSGN